MIACVTALVDDDPDRIGEVTALGLDEVLFVRQGRWRTQRWSTSIVDIGDGLILDLVAGLSPDELRRGHFSVLRQAVAEAGGAEVKNLGDGLVVVFASAAALGCAVGMQQGIERENRACEHSVGLRVGLSGGEVTAEDGDYFGDPVIEAARLCAASEGGQILAADMVRLMAGRRSRHECNPVGPLVLKGLPDPVAVEASSLHPERPTRSTNSVGPVRS